MTEGKAKGLPRKVEVKIRKQSRYDEHYENGLLEEGKRPMLWENRREGIDVIETTDDEELRLVSDGQQSPPAEGWTLMLTDGDAEVGFSWTLYGMSK